MAVTRWIVIPNWDRFQHYKDREPAWIKNYPELLSNPNYIELTPETQALLHKLWMLYAKSRRNVPLDTRYLSRSLHQRVLKRQLESLNHAGFIEIVASKPLASRTHAKRRVVPTLQEERGKRDSKAASPRSQKNDSADAPSSAVCPECGVTLRGKNQLAEHAYNQHGGPEPPHWIQAESRTNGFS